MLSDVVIFLIGLIAGVAGYWTSTFWMQPILKHMEIRGQVLKDFIYYKQAINSEGLNDEMKALHREQILANRKASAELSAVSLLLPKWFIQYLRRKGISPPEAATHLIGYSSTTDYEKSHKIEAFICRKLGLPEEK